MLCLIFAREKLTVENPKIIESALCFYGTHRVVGAHCSDSMTSQSSNGKEFRSSHTQCLHAHTHIDKWGQNMESMTKVVKDWDYKPSLSSHRAGQPSPSVPQRRCFQLLLCDPREKPPARQPRNSLRKNTHTPTSGKSEYENVNENMVKKRSRWPAPTLFLTMAIDPTTFRCLGFSLAKTYQES